MHAPVLWLVSYELGRRTDLSGTGLFLATLGSAVPVILVGSYAFHVVFERPFMRHRSLRDLRDALPRRVGAGPLRSLAAGRSGHGSTPVHVPVQPAPAGQAAARVATAPES